jgi:uncharacterized protein YdeI (YjbR/CyaY-like superfamily)
MKPTFFKGQNELRKWFEKNHHKEKEIWVGFYKKDSGKANYSWSQSVDQALCFGWIDGIRKSIDENSYMIRFTPRNPKSNWSTINIKKIKELTKLGLMDPAGVEAYKKREDKRSEVYSFEQDKVKLSKKYELIFKSNKRAWKFFQSLPPSTKKPSIWWVMSAKKEETKLRRLDILIKSSEKEEKIPPLRLGKKKN